MLTGPNEKEHGLQMMAAGGVMIMYRKIADDLARELLKAHPEGYDFTLLRDAAVAYVKVTVTNMDYDTKASHITAQIQLIDEFFSTAARRGRERNGETG